MNLSNEDNVGTNISKDSCTETWNTNITNKTEVSNNSCSNLQTIMCNDDSYLLYTAPVPTELSVIYCGAVLALIVVIINSVLISALLRKANITVINILLSVLGLSDMCCAVFACFPVCVGVIMDSLPTDFWHIDIHPGLIQVLVLYPFCVGFDVTNRLTDLFHTISMLITTFLSLLKALIMIFPMKTRIYLSRNVTVAVCIFIFCFCVAIYLPFFVTKLFFRHDYNLCCFKEELELLYRPTFIWINSITFMFSFFIMIVSTIYISLKLTIMKTNIQKKENYKTQRRNRRAAIIVVLIVMVFVLSEAIPVVCYLSVFFTGHWSWCVTPYFQYQQLIMLFGFASNFIIYSVMGKELRTQVYNCITCFRRNKGINVISGSNQNSS